MVFGALVKVMKKPGYLLLTMGVSAVAFAFAVWLPNFGLILKVLSSSADWEQKISIPLSLLESIATNFTLLSASYAVAIAILLGLYISLLVFYLRRRIAEAKDMGMATSFAGITSGIFGLGCAACGSLIITSVLSIAGAGWVLSILPLRGQEFGILGALLLLVALIALAKRIENPSVCKI